MDDISGQIGKILSDPNSMAQIQSIMNSLGAGGQGSPPQPQSQPQVNNSFNNQNSFSGQNNNGFSQNQPVQAQNALGGLGDLGGLGSLLGGGGGMNTDMIAALSRLAPIMGKARQEDNSTRLLLALKPMLSEKRSGKVDEAMRILQLIRLFPLLKDSGILSSLLGGII